ncbi:hypothetical protein CXF83_16675 [Shewanella sp. Choline-02u-19]|uniref:hypothetical protein n=1 Tax=unclassified Shewanella TaxID=196818 RepID=UPI000C332B9C|nr:MULTISPECIES: hypothetical protein [unclassified Shewanella]PKG57765.1 hypothetical protein CXF82_08055 [Shewanella sp. GutDb-MelDb]PKH57468.1 hypothetical protein CXF84_09230 [Shewanella sp. Bg11-22]PKI28230.1 hypothetical protein CXF83_16675 [Shewanella sp. Choline-02u-19]
MKKFKVVICLSVLLTSFAGTVAFAESDIAEKLNMNETKTNEQKLVDRTSSTEGAYKVQQGDSIVRSDTLTKGQIIFDRLSQPSIVTGDLVIKLFDNASSEDFANDHDLSISMNTESNLGIYTPKTDADLVKLLESIKKDDRVIRAKLDKSTNKYQIQ